MPAVVAALLLLSSCGDPTAPGPLPRTYRLDAAADLRGSGNRALPAGFGIPGTSAVLRVSGGSLTLRPDSTYEFRLEASRDSAGTSAPLPSVLASGRYRAVRTNGDIAFDYNVELTVTERPGESFTAGRDNFNGGLSSCCLSVAGVQLSFLFAR
jgi:hypothetical protein